MLRNTYDCIQTFPCVGYVQCDLLQYWSFRLQHHLQKSQHAPSCFTGFPTSSYLMFCIKRMEIVLLIYVLFIYLFYFGLKCVLLSKITLCSTLSCNLLRMKEWALLQSSQNNFITFFLYYLILVLSGQINAILELHVYEFYLFFNLQVPVLRACVDF